MEWREKTSVIVILPLFNIVQSPVVSNICIMEKMTEVLNKCKVSTSLYKREQDVYALVANGMENIFTNLFPLLEKYSHFLYWKSDSYNLLVWAKALIA